MLCTHKRYDEVDYLKRDIRSQIMDFFHTTRVAVLLLELNFDVKKYNKKNFDFLLADLMMFLHGLNKNYSIYENFEKLNSLDVMCFYEPWLVDFLEKVLAKKKQAAKL